MQKMQWKEFHTISMWGKKKVNQANEKQNHSMLQSDVYITIIIDKE